MPVISMIGVTRPLTAEERGGFRLADPFATDRRLLYYARMLPQGRLLFGMRGDLSGAEADAPRLRRRLRAHMDWMFPQWRDVALEFFWRGPVCMTRAQRPAVGRLEDDAGVFHAFAWHGSGVAAASAGGRLLAGLMLGANRAIPAPFAGLPPRIPLPGLRRLQLRAALTLYRGLDALDG
jgi:glycine/D-amino acid oxidase-like deaminating enzyme